MTEPSKDLVVYNSLVRKKEIFTPIDPPFVGIYVCGPTVYGHSHLGHAKTYICFDVIVRYLRHLGYRVRYVQNITDVGHLTEDTEEDKILKQSSLEKIEPMEVVEKYTASYFEDMDELNVRRPDISPRASGHVPEQIELIARLIERQAAYEAKGNVYFAVESFAGYGKLSGRRLEDQKPGARVEVDTDKRHPADFLLWRRAAPEHILKWNSPWGPGYPGWHLECSVMAMRYLGETVDLHGGGLENQFPHHECEIAQSETATQKPFVRYWLHNNMLTVDGQKMGKSLGNFVTLKDAFREHAPSLVRYYMLGSHYRAVLDYSEQALKAASNGLSRLRTAYHLVADRLAKAPAEDSATASVALREAVATAMSQFAEAMNDDFNTPRALASSFDFVSAVNRIVESGSDAECGKEVWAAAKAFFDELLGLEGVLGIDLVGQGGAAASSHEPQLVELLLQIRQEMRTSKNFAMSDKIRDELLEIGIEIKDTKDGTEWKTKAE